MKKKISFEKAIKRVYGEAGLTIKAIKVGDEYEIVADQQKPDYAVCPHCGKTMVGGFKLTRPRTYKDYAFVLGGNGKLTVKRVECRCKCGKTFTVPNGLIADKHLTVSGKKFIEFFSHNEATSQSEVAKEAGVSRALVHKLKEAV
jgi:hypothetical protein